MKRDIRVAGPRTGGTSSALVAQSAKRAGKCLVLAVFSATDRPPGAADTVGWRGGVSTPLWLPA